MHEITAGGDTRHLDDFAQVPQHQTDAVHRELPRRRLSDLNVNSIRKVRIVTLFTITIVFLNLMHSITPIFLCSAVNGKRLDLLRSCLNLLPPPNTLYDTLALDPVHFQVNYWLL